jgi:hypothetical protein
VAGRESPGAVLDAVAARLEAVQASGACSEPYAAAQLSAAIEILRNLAVRVERGSPDAAAA